MTRSYPVLLALRLLPVAAAQFPAHAPGWKVIGSVVALAVVGTAAAQLLS